LGPLQYSSVNPTSGSAVTDPSTKQAATVLLDGTVPMYYSNSYTSVWAPTSVWPTPRQLWSMGNATNPGWNGINYRYGPDNIVTTFGSSCPNGGIWNWVNQPASSGKKKRDLGHEAEDLYYQQATETWKQLTDQKGMSPQDAVLKMAMDACNANPREPLTEEQKHHLEMMHVGEEGIRRVCDTEPIDEAPVETRDAGFHEDTQMSHHGHSFRK